MRILALDVGDKRIGVAVTDPLGWTAQPLAVIERRDIVRDMGEILGLVRRYEARLVLVGLPLRTEMGEVGTQAKKVLAFCDRLRSECAGNGLAVEIKTWDESMTTKEAEDVLREVGATGKRRRKNVDKLAAAMLLSSYLESLKEKSSGTESSD